MTSVTTDTPTLSSRTAWFVTVMLTLVYAVNIADRFVLGTLIEPIKSEFGLSDTQVGLLTGFAFATTYSLFSFPIAYIADRWSRRNLICIAIAVFSFMTAITGFVQNFVQLLLARMGVALGETGTTPSSHSLISDYFPFNKRLMAMAVFTVGSSIGMWYGYSAAGYLADHYGWRNAMLYLSLPGLLIALLFWVTVREPPRGRFEKPGTLAQNPSYRISDALKFMWSQRAFRHLMFAMMLNHSFAYAHDYWTVPFLVRSHGMSLSQGGSVVGLWYGLLGGLPGALLGGLISQSLGYRDIRWHSWFASLVLFIGFFPAVLVYIISPNWIFYFANFLTGLVMFSFMGPVAAMTQNLVLPQMRALAAAIWLFSASFIGQVVGPAFVGMLSDYFMRTTDLGDESLRWALIASTFFLIWSSIHLLVASRTVKGDYARAGQSV